MPKPVNFGGQRRTIMMYCGKTFRGHPTEVMKIEAMHFRICKLCNPDGEKYVATEFNSVAASINGWDGMNGGNSCGVNTKKAAFMADRKGESVIVNTEIKNNATIIDATPLTDDMLEDLFKDTRMQSIVMPNKKKNKK